SEGRSIHQRSRQFSKRLLLEPQRSYFPKPVSNTSPSRPGEFHPEPLTDPDLNLSIHPARAIPESCRPPSKPRAPPVASWPFEVPTWIACPLRPADIPPLRRYYQPVRPSASHPYSRPRGSVHLWLLRLHRRQGSHVPYARLF